ncbi:MAG TPA: 2-C-methyl-D-erythritol 4-phosphate cytidylyltransferase [Acidimicrobiales bacterium]|nr:2-C-methyl-D-erythritol 4-phosphate cytidylyltransferase [Acidimicrobiales bacterium]
MVVAAGGGSRFGRAKQFEELGGQPLLQWSIGACRPAAGGVVLVLPVGDLDRGEGLGADLVVPGGAARAESVRAGLTAVPAEAEVVLVHDAARPLTPPSVFEAVVAAVAAGADGAVPALPVADTVKEVDGDRVVRTLDRQRLVAVQTPQGFRADVLRRAHAAGGDAPDDAALVEAIGGRVVTVAGDHRAMKITHAHDLVLATALLEAP